MTARLPRPAAARDESVTRWTAPCWRRSAWQWLRSCRWLAAAPALGGCASGDRAPPEPNLLHAPPAGYRLVWAEEFDRDGLPDPTRWVHDTGRNREGWHNHERQYHAGRRAENAVVRGGTLRITARRERLTSAADWGRQDYASARLITRSKAEWT